MSVPFPSIPVFTSAQAKVKEVADDINEARREAESLTRLYELASKIDDIDFVRLPSPLCS